MNRFQAEKNLSMNPFLILNNFERFERLLFALRPGRRMPQKPHPCCLGRRDGARPPQVGIGIAPGPYRKNCEERGADSPSSCRRR